MSTGYDRAIALLAASGLPHTIHRHAPAQTVADAKERLHFPVERFLKTIAFRAKTGGCLLAALRGQDRLDYRRLAAGCGIRRADIVQLSPEEVSAVLDVEIGSVGPLAMPEGAQVLFDTRVPTDATLFCGIGRTDRTLEIRLADLLRLTRGRLVPLTRLSDGAGGAA